MGPMPAWSEERTAIVTGGGSGIGRAIGMRLAAEGAAVGIWDLHGDAAAAVAGEIETAGGRAVGVTVDVAERSEIDNGVEETRARFDSPTILVNCAGISPYERFLDIDDESLDRVIAVNLKGTFLCCQAVVPHMIEACWGRIVNISSSSAQTGNARQVHYAASKAGVLGLTKSLAREMGPKGITVNTIPPSFVDTPPLREFDAAGYLGPGIEALEKAMPVQRVGQPEDIAAACAYLVRDEASYITGQVVGVNGGRVMD